MMSFIGCSRWTETIRRAFSFWWFRITRDGTRDLAQPPAVGWSNSGVGWGLRHFRNYCLDIAQSRLKLERKPLATIKKQAI
jgi:hypothetical protein